MKRVGSRCSHPTYPEYRDEYGEDPARILYHLNPIPRIRGIDDPGLLHAYLDVETDRDEPRREVVAALNKQLTTSQPDAEAGQAVATDGGEPR